MKHEDYKEMLAANAITALDAEDARSLAIHLEGCLECRTESGEWEETLAYVALDTAPIEPSARLRDRIMTAVHQEVTNNVALGGQAISAGSRVLPFDSRKKSLWTPLGSLAAIAAAIAIIAMLAGLIVLWQQNRSTRAELARLTTRAREANEQLATERALVALMSTPGARMTELNGTNAAPGAHAMLAYDKTGHAMLMTKNLPAAPPGKAYQLWFIKDNRKMPGKVFSIDASGNGVLEDQIPNTAMDSAVYAITLEPAAGVQVPTGAIYLVSAS